MLIISMTYPPYKLFIFHVRILVSISIIFSNLKELINHFFLSFNWIITIYTIVIFIKHTKIHIFSYQDNTICNLYKPLNHKRFKVLSWLHIMIINISNRYCLMIFSYGVIKNASN